MIRTLITAATLAPALALALCMVFAPQAAQACSANNQSACSVAEWQALRTPYKGPKSGARANTCVRLLGTTSYAYMTEVVLVAGENPVHGRVVTSLGRGNGHSFQLGNQPGGTKDVYIREFCFDGKLIAGLDTITFCNGLNPGDGNHHTLSLNDETAPYLRKLKQTGHVGDFLSLLGKERTYNAPVSTFFTERRYRKLYGGNGAWIGS